MSSTLDQLLAADGRTIADVTFERSSLGAMVRSDGIVYDDEVARVLALPRRPPASEQLIEALSAWLRKRPYDAEGYPNRLFPAQAMVLREMFEVGGAFCPMPVGTGKTLPTLTAPTLLGAQRPVLIVPASDVAKTRRDFARYHVDWHVRLPEIMTYQALGREQHANALIEADPDLLMLDEADKARNLDGAAVARRVLRAIERCRPRVMMLSGTLITDDLLDFWHLIVATLREHAPVPLRRAEAERWAAAVNRDVGILRRVDLGALAQIPGGFWAWLRGSRGVVPARPSDCGASIEVSIWRPTIAPEVRKTIARVIETSERPDGEPLDDWDLPDCLCQLALGFYYVWDPLPPDWWLRPRRCWRAYVRAVLDEHLEGFDSEGQIVSALDRDPIRPADPVSGDGFVMLPARRPPPPAADEGRQLLAAWREVRDRFEPNPVPVWLDDSVVRQTIADAGERCLVWVKYRAFGQALASYGLPYYGAGEDPETAPPGQTIAVSIAAHSHGKNLQAWNENLVTTPPANANAWEQLIGRTHRTGQRSPRIGVRVIGTIDYHGEVLGRVVTEARSISRAAGFAHKLVSADWT